MRVKERYLITNAMCILLVEDEQSISDFLVEVLEDEGFDTYTVSTSEKAADLIESPPDLLLLITDIDLPGAHEGIHLAQLTHHHHPSLPVLYITGRRERVGRLGSKEALLTKPFSITEFVYVVRRLLA